jgi:hypothetical protein
VARANMRGVPKDELVLAEALANVEARNLEFGVGGVGLNEDGEPFTFLGKKRVCVIGAFRCGKPLPNDDAGHMSEFEKETGLSFVETYLGNDTDGDLWQRNGGCDLGETLGYAFRVAMTEIK